MARTKIKTNGRYASYAECPKVVLQTYLEKQKWFIAASGIVTPSMDQTHWENKTGTGTPGKFLGRDISKLNLIMMADGCKVEIVVKMNPDQGFEIRMGYGQEQRRGDGSLVVWYSNNVEGAAERVKRHYETHGLPWAEKAKVRQAKVDREKKEKAENKREFETSVGATFGEERWSKNMYFEQGSFGITFRYETIYTHDELPEGVVGQKQVKLKTITGYFTTEEFKEFLEFMAARPRLVAERLQGVVSSMNPVRSI